MGKQVNEHLETFMKCRLDFNGYLLEAPARFCTMLGYTKSKLRGEYISNIVHPDERVKCSAILDKLRTGQSEDFESELTMLSKSGNPVPVFIAGILKRDKQGNADSITCYIQDLSEQTEILQKLEEREQQFNSLFRNNPHPVYYFDLKGNFDGVNDKLVEFTGYSREELLNKGFSEFIVKEDLEDTKRQFKEALQGNPGQYEIRVKVKDGIKDIRVTKFPRYSGENIVGVFGILQDITKEKASNKELKKSEQHFKSLFERNPDAVYSFDKKGNFIEANKALEELTGYTIEELKELNFEPLVAADNREKVRANFEKAARGEPQTYEASGVHKDGNIFYVQVANLPIYVDGEIVGVFGIAHDITERKLAQQKLKESEERWQQLVNQNPQPVQIVQDGKIVYINQAGREYYGALSQDELIGKSILDFVHKEDREKVLVRKQLLEKNENVAPTENRTVLLNGEERYIIAHSIPITYKGEQAIQTVVQDITDLKEKQKVIGRSLEEKETLLKEIHHRVKNNLAVISSMLELQIMQSEHESAITALRDSQLRIRSIAIIHEKLYQNDSLYNIRFDSYVQELVETIRHTYTSTGKNVDASFDMDSVSLDIKEVIPCSLIVNEVIVNCFKHAFTKRKTGKIHIYLEYKNPVIELKITDDGKGLPEGFNIDKQQSLGMTLIQALSNQLEGTIRLKNGSNGAGTIFHLKFEKKSDEN